MSLTPFLKILVSKQFRYFTENKVQRMIFPARTSKSPKITNRVGCRIPNRYNIEKPCMQEFYLARSMYNLMILYTLFRITKILFNSRKGPPSGLINFENCISGFNASKEVELNFRLSPWVFLRFKNDLYPGSRFLASLAREWLARSVTVKHTQWF